jgi:hypothetical protein
MRNRALTRSNPWSSEAPQHSAAHASASTAVTSGGGAPPLTEAPGMPSAQSVY